VAHLFRDCLLTFAAVEQPDLMQISPAQLTWERDYNTLRQVIVQLL
jgi:hypothetical protein